MYRSTIPALVADNERLTETMTLTIADITASEREHLEMCVHEGSHCVAGAIYGAELRNAVVIRSRAFGVEGLTRFEPVDFPNHANLAICYSGGYGQAKFRAGGGIPTARQIYDVFNTTGCKDAASLSLAGGEHLGHDAKPVIDRAWPAVIRVAQQLYRTAEIDQRAVLAALGITDGGGFTSVQLAAIRSRCRTVPPIRSKEPVPA